MTEDRRGPADHAARRLAVTTFHRPVVVLAGAGTGKTALLVERALFALLGEGVRPEGLLAVTFTEKAAAEMASRLEDALAALAAGEGVAGEAERALQALAEAKGLAPRQVAGRAEEALADLHHARVGTFHSFCMDLLRRHAHEAGLSPALEIAEEGSGDAALREAWQEFLAAELGEGGARTALWREVLAGTDLMEVHGTAEELCGLPLRAPLVLAAGSGVLRGRAEALAERIRGILQAAGPLMNPRCRERMEEQAAALERFVAEGRCEAVAAGNKPGKKLQTADEDLFRQAVEARDAANRLTRDLSLLDDAALERLLALLAPFVEEVRRRRLREGVVSFDDQLECAVALLEEHPEVRRAVAGGIQALLVDEFQDTDPVQARIVLALSEGAHASRLFVVGDPKQSIYRFRGADIEAYGRALEELERRGALALALETSFRSLPSIVESVNRIGPSLLPDERPFQMGYQPIAAGRESEEEEEAAAAVEVWTLEAEGETGAEERREREAQVLAEAVARDGAPFSRNAVLFRSLGTALPYIRALRAREVPFVVLGGVEFHRREEVVLGKALLRWLALPHDGVALLAVLRSPLCAVPDRELAEACRDRPLSLEALREAAAPARHPALAAALGRLGGLRRECAGLDPGEAATRALLSPPMRAVAASSFEGAQKLVNLEKLAGKAAALVREGARSLQEVAGILEREADRADHEEESPLADESLDVVRLMTVHRAKGLQFPVVYLPQMTAGRQERSRPRGACRLLRDGTGQAALALRCGAASTSAWLEQLEAGDRHEAAEERRILYVALTRAQDRLVLLCSRGFQERSDLWRWSQALLPLGYDDTVPPPDGGFLGGGAAVHRRLPAGTAQTRTALPREDPAPILRAVARREALRERAESALRPEIRAPSEEDDAPALLEEDRAPAAVPEEAVRLAVGSTVHRYLQGADLAEAALDGGRLAALAASAALEESADGGEVLGGARGILERFLASPLRAGLAACEVLGREIPLLLDDGEGGRWSGILDLLLREDGEVVVADYKTDRIEAEDAGKQGQGYQRQLDLYARGVQRALKLARLPRRRVVFLSPCVAVDL